MRKLVTTEANLDEFLARNPVFNRADLAAFCADLDDSPDGQLTNFISKRILAGKMFSLRGGVYAARLPGVSPEDTPLDPCLVAAKLRPDSVLAYHSALLHHGYVPSLPKEIPYLCDMGSPRFAFRTWEFFPVPSPHALLRQGQREFGVVTEIRSGVAIRVTSPERTLVDVLDRPYHAGGWDAAYHGLENMASLDLDAVVAYAMLLGKCFVCAKVGFFLEQHREQFGPTEDHLAQLRSLLPARLHPLEGYPTSRHYAVAPWNLSVPEPIMRRVWDVPQEYLKKPSRTAPPAEAARARTSRQMVPPVAPRPQPQAMRVWAPKNITPRREVDLAAAVRKAGGNIGQLQVEPFFRSHSSFKTPDFISYCAEQGLESEQIAKRILGVYRDAGHLLVLHRAAWMVVPEGSSPERMSIDPLLLPGLVADDAVLAYDAALALHGLSQSTPRHFCYLTDGEHGAWSLHGWHFKPIPLRLHGGSDPGFGIEVVERSGCPVRVTSLERTFVDVLAGPDYAGGWEEVCRSLQNLDSLNVDAVVEYALLLDREVLIGKVGFVLERRKRDLGVSAAQLMRLRQRTPKTMERIQGFGRVETVPVPAWGLLVPRPILEGFAPKEPARPSVVAPASEAPASPGLKGLDGFLARHPVFTHAEFDAFCRTLQPFSRRQLDDNLDALRDAGRVLRVNYHLWITVPRRCSPKHAPVDPLLLPGKACEDGVLAYHAALESHGYAPTAQPIISYLIGHQGSIWSFRDYEFRPKKSPLALQRKGCEQFGVVTVERAGMPVRVTSLARTFVDVLDRPDLGGGWEEVWRAVHSLEALDVEEAIEYAVLLGNQVTVSKTGFFLEQRAQELGVTQRDLERLQEHCVGAWVKVRGLPLAPYLSAPRWRISVPAPLVTGDWEGATAEVLVDEAGAAGAPWIPLERGQTALLPGQRLRKGRPKAADDRQRETSLPAPLAAVAEEFLADHPLFTRQELRDYCLAHGPGAGADTNRVLKWGEERGYLVMVQRPVWAAVPEGMQPREVTVDSFLLAEKLGTRARPNGRRGRHRLDSLLQQARVAGIDGRELDMERFFAAHPLFTMGDLARYVRSQGVTTGRQVDLLLEVCRETGQVQWLSGYLWAYAPEGDLAEVQPPDPLLVAARAAPDAALCYRSALAFHGWATSQPQRLTYLTEEEEGEGWRLGEVDFKPLPTPRALWGSGHDYFGIDTAERSGVSVRVTSPERTFVDALDQPKLSGGWEEVCRALENARGLDIDALVDYAIWLGDPLTIAKVGYFLDRRKREWGIGQGPFNRLRRRRPTPMRRIPGFGEVRHIPIRPWNLEVPYAIHYGLWAEEDRAAEQKEETPTAGPALPPRARRLAAESSAKVLGANGNPLELAAAEFLASHPVFSHAEFDAYCQARVPASREELKRFFKSLGDARRVFSVAHGLWAVVQEGFLPVNAPVDPFLLPGRTEDQGIIAYHAALELHGVAFSAFPHYHYLSASKWFVPWTWRGYHFQPLPPPTALKRRDAGDFGVITIERSGLPVQVTSLERTLVDVLTRTDLGGGWAEAGRSFDSVNSLDVDAVVEYALLLENSVTAAKVGWYLEHHPHAWGVTRDHLNRLRAQAPDHWYPLREFRGAPVESIRGWHLRMPPALAVSNWDEVERLTAQTEAQGATGRRRPLVSWHSKRSRSLPVRPASPVQEVGDRYLASHPVFTTNALRAHCQETCGATLNQVDGFLSNHQRNGRILLVRRPVWAVVPQGSQPEETPVDPLLVAAHAREDACLSHQAALQIHGYAHSEPQYYTYLTDTPANPSWHFRSYTFVPLRPPQGLVKRDAVWMGTTTVERAGLPIRMTTLERTFVDVLMHPEWNGGWEESWRALTRIKSLDIDEVVRYASMLDNATLVGKVGFFLESHQRELRVTGSQLEELRRYRPRCPTMAKGAPEYRLVSVARWNLSLPYPAVYGEWEERPKTPRRRRAPAVGVSG